MKNITIVLLLILLVSCSNQKIDQYTTQQLSGITIDNIQYSEKDNLNKTAFFLRQELERILSSKGEILYTLDIKLDRETKGIAIQNTTESVRRKNKLTLFYTLKSINSAKVIKSGKLKFADTFNTSSSPYSSYVAQEEISVNMALIMAQKLRLQLINLFQNNDQAVPTRIEN